MESKKIEVRFVSDLYPYSKGDTGFIREDFALGQFKNFVEILGVGSEEAESKAVFSPEVDKSMRKRSKKTK